MNRTACALLFAWILAAGGGDASAAEPWEEIRFKVPLDANGAVHTGSLFGLAHIICQGLGARHYRSGSSRLGRTIQVRQARHGGVREVVAACTAEGESAVRR